MEFFVLGMEAALFGRVVLGKKVQLAADLSNQLADLLDDEPVILPVPDDAPPDIPRIILKSKNGRYSVNIKLNNVSFKYTEKGKPANELQAIREEFLQNFSDFTEILIKLGVIETASRLGSVTEFLVFTQDPIDVIKRNFLRPEELEELSQIDLGLLTKTTWDDVQINRWHRFTTRTGETAQGSEPYIIFAIDINTKADIEYKFSHEAIVGFYSRVYTDIEKDLKVTLIR